MECNTIATAARPKRRRQLLILTKFIAYANENPTHLIEIGQIAWYCVSIALQIIHFQFEVVHRQARVILFVNIKNIVIDRVQDVWVSTKKLVQTRNYLVYANVV